MAAFSLLSSRLHPSAASAPGAKDPARLIQGSVLRPGEGSAVRAPESDVAAVTVRDLVWLRLHCCVTRSVFPDAFFGECLERVACAHDADDNTVLHDG